MYDTAERVKQVQLCVRELHRKREKQFLRGLTFLCAVLTFTLIGAIDIITNGCMGVTLQGLYGTMLLYENAGGYVFIAVLSFSAAVVITMLYIRYSNKKKNNIKEK